MDTGHNNGVHPDRDPGQHEVKLEQVLGVTVSNNSALACDHHTGCVAYPAGCVVVLYNARRNKQNHLISSSKKTIAALSFSSDGKYLVAGECGHSSHLRVWDVQKQVQVAELSGHKYGINCVAFSPNMKYVVSVGSQNDMIVNVWDWKNNIKVASNKVSCKVKSMCFSSGGNYFVTVGNHHVKFWYLEYARSTKYKPEPVPLMGRSAILGDQRNNYFCDVACGNGEMADSTYAITKSGLLCEFNGRRLLDKWVELRTTVANSLSVGEGYIFVGCAEGVVRCFSPYDLHFICTLPRPHYLGVDVAKGLTGRHMSSHPSSAKYPDAIATVFDETNKKVTCIYSDHSMYVWDVRDIKKVGKSHSFLYHSACIWGIETYSELKEGSNYILPPGTFFTCSSDDTIRIWNLEPNMTQTAEIQRNIYCSELLKILYTDPDLTFLCDVDLNPSSNNDKVDTTYDSKNGVRCLKISPDGRHLASGDRSGNVRIFNLQYMEMLCKIEAHDSEVLCLEYSKFNENLGKYLASASRDRLIHVFDVDQDYDLLQTLDDHSSSVTAARFAQHDNQLQLVSCGADKAIIFRRAHNLPHVKFLREHHIVGKTTLYDMEVDASQQYVLTACQDCSIRVYNVDNGKYSRCFLGSQEEEGTLIKVVMDSSGSLLATSSTNKSFYIYDYFTGECLSSVTGHSELVTGIKFMPGGKHIVSVSGDGCIFVWKLPAKLIQNNIKNSKQMAVDSPVTGLWQDSRKSAVAVTKPLQVSEKENNRKEFQSLPSENIIDSSPSYQFNVGQLPSWAKKQMTEDLKPYSNLDKQSPPPIQPRGRWAQRLDGQALVVKSYLQADSSISFPSTQVQQTEQTVTQYSTSESSSFDIRGDTVSQSKQISITRSATVSHGISSGRVSSPLGGKHDRVRHLTDSSSASSLRVEDEDAEDERSDSGATECSEMIYYPKSEENSEIVENSFHVCATNEDGRQVQKNSRAPRSDSFHKISMNFPDRSDMVSDEDDSGTPVEGDHPSTYSSRSFSMSTENLERLDLREKFMRSNYESLDKRPSELRGEKDSGFKANSLPRHSISTKYLSTSPQSNSTNSGLNKQAQIQISQTPSKRREELTKALNDARKKLETLGWRGGLSTSKSVGDLRSIPDKEPIEKLKSRKIADDDGDIRRSTSYSDLSSSQPNIRRRLPSTPRNLSGKDDQLVSAPLWAQAKGRHSHMESAGPEKTHSLASERQNMSRSASVGTLNRPEPASSPQHVIHKTPTVHHMSRMTASQQHGSVSNSLLTKSSSSVNVSSIGRSGNMTSRLSLSGLNRWHQSDSSSSSDASPTENKPNVLVPRGLVARRLKAFANDGSPSKGVTSPTEMKIQNILPVERIEREPCKSKSEWDLRKLNDKKSDDKEILPKVVKEKIEPPSPFEELNSVTPEKLIKTVEELPRENIKDLEASPKELPVRDMGPSDGSGLNPALSATPLTQEMCENVAEELKRVTLYAMQVFQRVTVDPTLSPVEKTAMTTTLAQGVWQAQQNLRPAIPPLPYSSTSGIDTGNIGQNKSFTGLPSTEYLTPIKSSADTQAEVNAMALLQQYSDRLLSLVEQRISNKNTPDKPSS